MASGPAVDEPGRGLARRLGLLDASAIVVGSMIGSGIFITSAETARLVGSPGWLIAAWVVAGLLTITGAACCAELAAMMPHAGGQYVFLREAYGPMIGFLFGWATFLVVQSGTIAAVAVAFAKFLGVFLPVVGESNYLLAPVRLGSLPYAISLSTQQLVAIAVILGLSLVNMRGLETGSRIQNLFTATKTLALLGLIVLGLFVGASQASAAFTSSWFDPAANGWNPREVLPPSVGATGALALALAFGKGLVGPLFSQTAWNNVTFTGEETVDPGRTLPRALLFGCGTVVVLYILANLAYTVVLPLEGIQNAPLDRVGTATMQAVLGDVGLYAMAAAILISTFGCVNGITLAGARVYYAMARDGLFFAPAARLNARQVPAFALLAQGVWAALLTMPRTITTKADGSMAYGNVYTQLLEYIVSADLAFYALMAATVVVLRYRQPDRERPFRTPLYPLPPLLYLAIALLILLDLLYLAPGTAGIGFLIVLSGLPVYALWHALGRPGSVRG